jgi:pSer/pThr/pTyr-binding forkhead associated (FHA) protein
VLYYSDGGSSNGSWLNNAELEVHKSYAIKNGDLINVGGETELKIMC